MSTSPFSVPKFRWIFITCWLIWIGLQSVMLHSFYPDWQFAMLDSSISNVLLMFACILLNNSFRFYLPKRERYGYILGICAILTVGWLLISGLVFQLVNKNVNYAAFYSETVYIRLAIGFLIIGCMGLLSVLWYTLQEQQEHQKRKMEADKLAKEAELYKLRQQLQPHFLFNSLNSINALIGSRPGEARQMIQQLSDFLRGTLRKEENQWINLSEELQQLQLYLDIEKVRFGHRMSAQIINDAEGNDIKIPAMLLQPVVENAIKFGLYDTTEAITITIQAEVVEGQLIIVVQNPFDPTTSNPQKGTGFGLSSVKRRLYLLFARNDLLQTETVNEFFITKIKVPQLI